MKTSALKLAAAISMSLFAACSTVTVTTDYDRSASFAKYKTYRLAPAAHGHTLSPVTDAALRASLRRELAARGIAETSSGKSDLAIVRHVFLEQKISVNQYTDWGYGYGGGWPYRYGYYGMWAGAPRTYVDVSRYTEGTLVLDFVDTRTQRLVFRGIGKAVVAGPESNARKIDEAVTKMIAAFPTSAPR
jgi:hypothetical protein